MIASDDRSKFIGASDTKFVVGKWTSQTFARWWGVKQGIIEAMPLHTSAIMAGRYYEHAILDSLGVRGLVKDEQKIIGRLRVNLDGRAGDTIYEIKTHSADKLFKMPKEYVQQVNVEMYAFGLRKAFIVVYSLTEEDYSNYYLPIDQDRLEYFGIEYDEQWVNEIYLPRLDYLTKCLRMGEFPKENEYENYRRGC